MFLGPFSQWEFGKEPSKSPNSPLERTLERWSSMSILNRIMDFLTVRMMKAANWQVKDIFELSLCSRSLMSAVDNDEYNWEARIQEEYCTPLSIQRRSLTGSHLLFSK